VSISGNVIAISGTATVAGTVSIGNTPAVTTNVSGNTLLTVPAWYGAVDVSGWFLKVSGAGFSGANVIGNYSFDYSGQQFIANPTTTSGQGIPFVSIGSGIAAQISGASVLTSVSGNVISISGTASVAGAVTTSVSGNQVYLGSGSNYVFISGAPAVTVSGNVISISGTATIAGAVTTSVSGNFVALGSGSVLGLSGLIIGMSGQFVQTSVSGNVVSQASGAYLASGLSIRTSVSGNTVAISGLYFTTVYESGLGVASGVMGPVGLMAWDLSGAAWNPVAVSNSGANDLRIAGTIQAASNISGQAVFLGSGSVLGLSGLIIGMSGQFVQTSVSGNVVAVSGSVTTITSVSGNVVSISGLWTSINLQSGQTGVSGAQGVLAYAYDLSGLKWSPLSVDASGSRTLHVTASGDGVSTSVSGNVVTAASGVWMASGIVPNISGQTVDPAVPTYIKSNDNTRFSVASGGTALTSITCVACTIRNIGNSGDVILVGSLSSPPYFGTSGQAWPAVSGMGLWLRDGDAVTINTNSTGNIKITANLSGTPVSYIAIG
jgi:hypothetical protein